MTPARLILLLLLFLSCVMCGLSRHERGTRGSSDYANALHMDDIMFEDEEEIRKSGQKPPKTKVYFLVTFFVRGNVSNSQVDKIKQQLTDSIQPVTTSIKGLHRPRYYIEAKIKHTKRYRRKQRHERKKLGHRGEPDSIEDISRPSKYDHQTQTAPTPAIEHSKLATQSGPGVRQGTQDRRQTTLTQYRVPLSTPSSPTRKRISDQRPVAASSAKRRRTSTSQMENRTTRSPPAITEQITTTRKSRSKATKAVFDETKPSTSPSTTELSTTSRRKRQTTATPTAETGTPSYSATDALFPRSIRSVRATLQATSVPGQFVTPMEDYLKAYATLSELVGYFGTVWYFVGEAIDGEVGTIRTLLTEDRKQGGSHYETVEGMLDYESTLKEEEMTGTVTLCGITNALHFSALIFEEATVRNSTKALRTRVTSLYDKIIAPQFNWFVNALAYVNFPSFPNRKGLLDQYGLEDDEISMELIRDLSKALNAFYYEMKRLVEKHASTPECNIVLN